MLAVLPLLGGCAPSPMEMEVNWVAGGLDIEADQPLEWVEVIEGDRPVVTHHLPLPSPRVAVVAPIKAGHTYRIRGHGRGEVVEESWTYPDFGPALVEVEAPLGQDRRRVVPDERVLVPTIVEVEVGLVITALQPGPVTVRIGHDTETLHFDSTGERKVRRARLADMPLTVSVDDLDFSLWPKRVALQKAREQLEIVDVILPTDRNGERDSSRPLGRVTLPASWWRSVLRTFQLGYRPLDSQSPWGWQSVVLRNRGDEALNVVVGIRILDTQGAEALAFRPRLREMDGDIHTVTGLVRVPARAEATAALPLYIDGSILPASGARFVQEVVVAPLGASQPLHRIERDLYVSRGSSWASTGFVALILASILGWLLLWRKGPGWVRTMKTSELMTVSLFGSLTFVVGAASQLLGMGVASVLGPFSPLVMGIVDDAFRMCLLGTLVTLIPRPGVVTLATFVGYFMRGIALGAFHPVDVLYLGSAVFWIEGMLWISGVTRNSAWLEEGRFTRWLRLSVGFGLSNVLATACALVVSVVMYRLYYAGWYVALILTLPGFIYVVAACWLAVDFADSLRRVAS
ncbi:MAG: hypothetical protein HN348_02310 [Proteobacteria bacterium]|jgi:hypothetical protein|nr:hypothetical protein [Pseudomonadota bacterium]